MSAASVKEYEGRNWDGFFDSPEYVNFANAVQDVFPDKKIHQSPYFGNVAGIIFGEGIDNAFEEFQERIQKNSGKVAPRLIMAGMDNPTSKGIPWLLLAAAAAAFFIGS